MRCRCSRPNERKSGVDERRSDIEEWDAEIVEQTPDQRIAWKDVGGAMNTGIVTFGVSVNLFIREGHATIRLKPTTNSFAKVRSGPMQPSEVRQNASCVRRTIRKESAEDGASMTIRIHTKRENEDPRY